MLRTRVDDSVSHNKFIYYGSVKSREKLIAYDSLTFDGLRLSHDVIV